MKRIYTLDLPVSPFLIAPVAQQNIEAAIVLGPSILSKRSAEVVDLLHGPISRIPIRNPIFAQLNRFRGRLLASTTFRTRVPDALSLRQGLKITVGVIIQPDTFRCYEDVTLASLILLDAYINRIVSISLIDGGTDQLASLLQQPTIHLDEVFQDIALLSAWFEGTFCVTSQEGATLWEKIRLAYRISRLTTTPRMCPASTLQAIARFWWYIDQRLHRPARGKPSFRQYLQLDVPDEACPLLPLLNGIPREPRRGVVSWYSNQRRRTDRTEAEEQNRYVR